MREINGGAVVVLPEVQAPAPNLTRQRVNKCVMNVGGVECPHSVRNHPPCGGLPNLPPTNAYFECTCGARTSVSHVPVDVQFPVDRIPNRAVNTILAAIRGMILVLIRYPVIV